MRVAIVLAGLTAAAALAAAAPGPAPATIPAGSAAAPASSGASFAANALWDDGRAEIDAYDAAVRRYGIPRKFTAYLIVVKEDFSRRQLVKADPGHDPADLFAVLKLNHVINYQTGIYTYHQMASCFFDRATMDLVKLSLTSNEWCGNTYKEYTRRDGRGTLHAHTYWDGQADVTYDLSVGPDVVFYDQLPLWIRSLPQTPGTTRALRLLPTIIDSKGPRPVPRAATLRASGQDEILIVPAGGFRVLRWDLQMDGERPEMFWTSRVFPYVLVAWDRPDGAAYRLKWTQRLAYWTLNRPGDESRLEGPAAPPPAGAHPAPSPRAPARPPVPRPR